MCETGTRCSETTMTSPPTLQSILPSDPNDLQPQFAVTTLQVVRLALHPSEALLVVWLEVTARILAVMICAHESETEIAIGKGATTSQAAPQVSVAERICHRQCKEVGG